MSAWAAFVLRHRKWVIGLWGLVVVAGIAVSGTTSSRLTVDSLPGLPGTAAANKINQVFGNAGDTSPYVVTVTLPAGRTVAGHTAQIAKAFTAVSSAEPDLRSSA